VSAPSSRTQRPIKELHGFNKIFLQPGQEEIIEISIDDYATSFWDESEEKWCSEKGVYVVMVADSSAPNAQRVTAEFEVEKTRYWSGL
jgi:beta-glucosidase